jgi:hypothetical protein
LEYLAASKRRRFVFLLANETPWPGTLRDSDEAPDYGKRIRDLRTRLINETWTGFFKSPDDLAKQVLISLMQDDSTKDVNQLSALDDIRSAEYLGPSFLPNIQQRLGQLGSVDFVAITLGPTPWWTTRLHLVAALVSDFSDIRQFVLLDGEGRFVVMASPSEFRRALTKAHPKLEIAYLRSRELGRGSIGVSDLDAVVLQYPIALAEVFGGQEEATVKQVVTPTIVRELGIKQQGEVLEERTEHSQFNLNSAILQRQMPYVILTQRGKLKGVIDRVELVSRIARTVSD